MESNRSGRDNATHPDLQSLPPFGPVLASTLCGRYIMRTVKALTIPAAALVILLSSGCQYEQPEAGNAPPPESATATTNSVQTDAQLTETSGTITGNENTVEVGLNEYSIEIPNRLPAGQTLFTVTNSGTVEHNFEIQNDAAGINKTFDQNLQPQEVRTLVVDLVPGTYQVYCPVDGHREQGMRREIEVTK